MDEQDNPARRLHVLLSEGKKQPNQVARAILAKLLTVEPPEDLVVLHRRLAKAIELPGRIKEQVQRLRHFDETIHLRWHPTVVKAFDELNLFSPWGEFINKIDDVVLYSLEVCSHALSREMPERLVPADDLARVLEQVRALADEVVASDLDDRLKVFVLDQLRRIEEAIQDYRLTGVPAIRDAVYVAVGALVVERETQRRLAGTKFWAPLVSIISVLANLATIATLPLMLESHDDGKPATHVEVCPPDQSVLPRAPSPPLRIEEPGATST